MGRGKGSSALHSASGSLLPFARQRTIVLCTATLAFPGQWGVLRTCTTQSAVMAQFNNNLMQHAGKASFTKAC